MDYIIETCLSVQLIPVLNRWKPGLLVYLIFIRQQRERTKIQDTRFLQIILLRVAPDNHL